MKAWLVRLPLVMLIAALMGWGGLVLMYLGGPYLPAWNDFWTLYVTSASILLWSTLSFFLSERPLSHWLIAGLFSPLLGCLLVAPPASFAFVLMKLYVAIPVGMMTAVLLWGIFHLPRRRELCDFPFLCG